MWYISSSLQKHPAWEVSRYNWETIFVGQVKLLGIPPEANKIDA